jgi:hypothetical protein
VSAGRQDVVEEADDPRSRNQELFIEPIVLLDFVGVAA